MPSPSTLLSESPPVSPNLARAPRLSEDLQALLDHSGTGGMTVRAMEAALRGRGLAVLVVILCLPFLFPVSIPGVSTVFGVSIGLFGLRLATGRPPWLPEFLLDREIPAGLLQRILGYGLRGSRAIESLIRPRMRFLDRWPVMLQVSGALVAANGLLLAVPVPPMIPLTNTIPAVGIIALMLGRMEKDGAVTLIGYFFSLLAIAYFTAIGFYGTVMISWVRGLFGS
jgi:hypothetical protein